MKTSRCLVKHCTRRKRIDRVLCPPHWAALPLEYRNYWLESADTAERPEAFGALLDYLEDKERKGAK